MKAKWIQYIDLQWCNGNLELGTSLKDTMVNDELID